jgi:hypothetical protein
MSGQAWVRMRRIVRVSSMERLIKVDGSTDTEALTVHQSMRKLC